MENICYIIESQKKYFKPFVGMLVPDAEDQSIFVIASGPKGTLDESQAFIKENAGEMKFFLNPVKSNETSVTWFSEILKANQKKRLNYDQF